MSKSSNGVGRVSYPAPRKVCGTGYIILSRVMDRDTYVKKCLRERTVTIITQEQEVISTCYVSKGLFNHIEFPDDLKTRGTCVSWINIPNQNGVIILSVLEKQDEYNENQTENGFSFSRTGENAKTSISGNGDQGTLNVVLDGENENQSGLRLRLLNAQQAAIFDLLVQGDLKIEIDNDADFTIGNKLSVTIKDEQKSENQAQISYILGTGFDFTDEFNNNVKTSETGVEVNVAADKTVAINQEGGVIQSVLLGDDGVDTLNKMINLLGDLINTLQVAGTGATVLTPPLKAKFPSWIKKVYDIQNSLVGLKSKTLRTS